VAAQVQVGCGDLLREAGRTSAGADLLVVPARDGRTWRERISGTSTERMVRATRIPVLVARQPLTRARASEQSEPLSRQLHQRLLACVDLGPGSGGVMAAALSLGGTSQIEVFHALSPQRAPSAGTGTAVERSRAALLEQIAQAGAQGQATPRVGFGDPGASVVARQRAVGADLVVLGKRPSRLLGDYFLGAVAREVLSSSTGDVLVVPTAYRLPRDLPPAPDLPERATLG
jgi:nucleotide-binding universal stress UspA family protein